MMCDMHDCVNKLMYLKKARIQGELYKRSRKQHYPGQKKRLKAIILHLVILSNNLYEKYFIVLNFCQILYTNHLQLTCGVLIYTVQLNPIF